MFVLHVIVRVADEEETIINSTGIFSTLDSARKHRLYHLAEEAREDDTVRVSLYLVEIDTATMIEKWG